MSELLELGPDDLAETWQLGRLAFGGDPDGAPPTGPRASTSYGLRDDRGRLVAALRLLAYEQWWGGRLVPMTGVASVAVHPDVRGQGLASRLLTEGLERMPGAVSALFPTVVGLYRGLGWEVVGSYDETVLRTGDLAAAGAGGTARTVGTDEAELLQDLYEASSAAVLGRVRRTGPLYAGGPAHVYVEDVDQAVLGESADGAGAYALYERGRGYRDEAALEVHELVATGADAARAVLRLLGGWHPVAPATRWRGSAALLDLLLPTLVPPPVRRQPWMLRVLDPAAAVAARGWAAEVDTRFVLVDPQRGETAHRLVVEGGQGRLEPADPTGPRLHVRGLALLVAGAAGTARLRALGLLDGELPGLDTACALPPADLLDDF